MNPLGPSRTNLFLPECVKQPVDWMELSRNWTQVPEVIGMVIYPLQMALYVYFSCSSSLQLVLACMKILPIPSGSCGSLQSFSKWDILHLSWLYYPLVLVDLCSLNWTNGACFVFAGPAYTTHHPSGCITKAFWFTVLKTGKQFTTLAPLALSTWFWPNSGCHCWKCCTLMAFIQDTNSSTDWQFLQEKYQCWVVIRNRNRCHWLSGQFFTFITMVLKKKSKNQFLIYNLSSQFFWKYQITAYKTTGSFMKTTSSLRFWNN